MAFQQVHFMLHCESMPVLDQYDLEHSLEITLGGLLLTKKDPSSNNSLSFSSISTVCLMIFDPFFFPFFFGLQVHDTAVAEVLYIVLC